MSTSFDVNVHDLQFILKQIMVSELQAGGVSTLAAIQSVYGVSAADAALLPAGLRTVDGRDNNLLPGRSDLGASGTEFPRLTDPVYSDDADGDAFGPVTNTDYGQSGSVADADPRTISNLLVDQTVANPAAIYAALKAQGVTGQAANAIVASISAAHAATTTAGASASSASAAVVAAQNALSAAVTAHTAAATADAAADESAAGLTSALAQAETARAAAQAAQAAADALAAELAVPTGSDANALLAGAQSAAQTAAEAAALLVSLLGEGASPEALAVDAGAQALLAALDGLIADSVLDGSDGPAAQAAAAAYAAVSAPGGTADDAAADLSASLGAAQSAAAATQTTLDAATLDLSAAQQAYDAAVEGANGATGTYAQASAFLGELISGAGLEVGADGGLVIQNLSPDVGLSPSFNNLFTIFGQFFDHGLDLVSKGGNGTVYIPLEADDPLVAGNDGVFGTADDLPPHLRFMALTRATPTANGGQTNNTTAFVDQNQTYTSHASHQVFLREQVRMDLGDGMKAYSTGRLIDGDVPGTIGTWADVKEQALQVLGIRLSDTDVHRVPLLATDAYGNLIVGANGYAQMVMAPDSAHAAAWLKEGTAAGITTEGSLAAGPAFLEDIAHNANPGTTFDHDGNPATPPVEVQADADAVAGNPIATDARGNKVAYDDELLDLHFVTGDGRGNENIGLSAVHGVFHAEHNRILEANRITILESGDLAFINEWLLGDLTQAQLDAMPSGHDALAAFAATLVWDGDRMFQAARFSTEMQYQHMVFEEFARRIQPAIDPFVFTNTADIDPSILAEFAHTVYRFGHSMLTDTIDRLDNDLQPVSGPDGGQMSLIEAFLNPQAYMATAEAGTPDRFEAIQGAILRGLAMDVGSEIDEFVVPALRSNLLGLPLDLAALNIARGRETGIPSLNQTRAQLHNDFGVADLKPYESWSDFAQHLKNPVSLINFVAAYGTHASIVAAGTLEAKRDAATLLVLGDTDLDGDGTIGAGETAPADRFDFLGGTGAYAGSATGRNALGGLNAIDLWIGGLAEKVNEFGGMLGTTFNFIFEYQLEQLQNGDRLYYLSRTQGLNLLDALESNTFADIMMRNSALGDVHAPHIYANAFLTPDHILELDRGIAQADYNDGTGRDPVWDDPLLQAIDPKVRRDYTNSTTVAGHDVGGKLVFRGGEHVVLGGTEGADILISDIGDDTIWGDGGNDRINTGQGADQAFGGDGDDIIENPFGDDFLRGERGNDVISAARGANVLFGGQGSDAILIGQDASEAFGGQDSDFILGGSGADNLLGNEGDDWIEGGEGFDTISGDNSELFFNSTIIGHDVAWGQGNDQDYDLESGDDIAFSGIGIQRFEGMFGFDWAIAKYDVAGADWDADIPIFTSVPAEILRDRFDLMEAFSGWNFNDVIRGDDRGTLGALGGLDPNLDFDDHLLDAAGLARIAGMTQWFGGVRGSLAALSPDAYADPSVMFRDGNILLGGAGSDTLQGRGGFDLIDGDAWLNVRIRIVVGGVEYSAESLNSSTAAAGPHAGKVFFTDAAGAPDFARGPAFGSRSLTSLLQDGTINPGALSIVREMITRPDAAGIDTAVFAGNVNEYLIEGRGSRVDLNGDGDLSDPGENVLQAAWDLNGDGFISVTDTLTTRAAFDDTDFLKNMERLQFADGIVDLTTPLGTVLDANIAFLPTVLPASTALPGAGTAIGQLVSDVGGGTFSLLPTSSPAIAIDPAGLVSLAAALGTNQTHSLDIRLTTGGGSDDETILLRTDSGASSTIAGGSLDEIVYALGGNDIVTGGGGDDVLFGQAGTDNLSGGDGADVLVGGTGNDVISGGAGNDVIHYAVGQGTDSADGGEGNDAIRYTGSAANSTVSAVWNGTALTAMTGFASIASVETIDLDLGAGTDRLSYAAASAPVSVDLSEGTASGFGSILGIENVTGSAGADTLRGNALANAMSGGAGDDLFLATVDDARDSYAGSAGSDTLDYGLYTTGLTIDLSVAGGVALGTGSGADTSDILTGIENLVAGAGNDVLTGNGAANRLAGGAGDDRLSGGAQNDVLLGDGGSDVLIGGTGADRLTGGAENDVFVYNAINESTLGASDTILDFEGAGVDGGDVIDVSALTATPFTFIGTDAFASGASNQIRTVIDAGNTILLFDTDNDTGAEMRIVISGTHNFNAADFVL